ncbi:MAG: aldo/keto reductase [Phycisphaerales bacterium]|nr:aldo/keto reductase [Phycisphaerales bacterium]
MALNHYVTLGRSGLRVSPLCLGTMTFGLDWGWGSDEDTSKRILAAYMDAGGNFIDTANMYTKGHSEVILGQVLGGPRTGSNHKRDRVVLATKFLGNLYPGDPNGGGAGRKAVIAACEQSLRRLRTDSIDLYWMHFWDRHTPIEETMRALDDLVREGKVRYVGFSDTPAWKCAQAQCLASFHAWSPVIALQVEYSLLQRTVEGDLVPMAREMGMGVTPWSPLKGGLLSGKYSRGKRPTEGRGASEWVPKELDARTVRVIDALDRVAAEARATPSQVAIAWVQQKPGVTSTIIGARTIEQLRDNLAALDVRLTPEQLSALDEATTPDLNFPHQFLKNVTNAAQGGTSINGTPSEVWKMAPQSDAERH